MSCWLRRFCFRFVTTEVSKAAGTPTAPACKPSVVSSFVWERVGSSAVPCHSFSGTWRKTPLLALRLPDRGSAWRPRWHFSRFPVVTALLCLGLWSHRRRPCLFSTNVILVLCRQVMVGSSVRWRWETSAGNHQIYGSLFSAKCGTVRLVSGPQIGPQLSYMSLF
jgi:hypothetical protein